MKTQSKFETGATTAASNNLVLSVLNDGSMYETCKHIGFAMLQGSSHRGMTFRDLAQQEAEKQGGKFKASDITEAGKLIKQDTIEHCLDLILDEWNNTSHPIKAYCRRWFDKANGNSYFSVQLQFPTLGGNKRINIPMQYGYGNQWEYAVIDLLEKHRFIPNLPRYENGNKDYGYMSDYERNNLLAWIDEGYGLKRNLYRGIYL